MTKPTAASTDQVVLPPAKHPYIVIGAWLASLVVLASLSLGLLGHLYLVAGGCYGIWLVVVNARHLPTRRITLTDDRLCYGDQVLPLHLIWSVRRWGWPIPLLGRGIHLQGPQLDLLLPIDRGRDIDALDEALRACLARFANSQKAARRDIDWRGIKADAPDFANACIMGQRNDELTSMQFYHGIAKQPRQLSLMIHIDRYLLATNIFACLVIALLATSPSERSDMLWFFAMFAVGLALTYIPRARGSKYLMICDQGLAYCRGRLQGFTAWSDIQDIRRRTYLLNNGREVTTRLTLVGPERIKVTLREGFDLPLDLIARAISRFRKQADQQAVDEAAAWQPAARHASPGPSPRAVISKPAPATGGAPLFLDPAPVAGTAPAPRPAGVAPVEHDYADVDLEATNTPLFIEDNAQAAPAPAITPTSTAVLNERYQVHDLRGGWSPGNRVVCRDLTTNEAVDCVRICAADAIDDTIRQRITALTNAAVGGLESPLRAITVGTYQSDGGPAPLRSGDLILIFRHQGTDSLFSFRDSHFAQQPPLPAIGPYLSSLAQALDACHHAGFAFDGIMANHLRVVGSGQVLISALAFLGRRLHSEDAFAEQDQLLLAEGYAGERLPGTVFAAAFAACMAPAALRQHVSCHDGRYRPLATLPFAINRVIGRQLTTKAVKRPQLANEVLVAVQRANRVAIEAYLTREQLRRLREDEHLDDQGIIQLIHVVIARERSDLDLLYDQAPRRLSDDEIAGALGEQQSMDRLEKQFGEFRTARLVARIVAGLLTCILLLLWWNHNDRQREGLNLINKGIEGSYGTFFAYAPWTNSCPDHRLEYIPDGAGTIRYFVQFAGLPKGSQIRLDVLGPNDERINGHGGSPPSTSGWLYVDFSPSQLPGVRNLKGRLTINGQVIQEEWIGVSSSIFGSLFSVLLLIGLVWGTDAAFGRFGSRLFLKA